MVSVNKNSYSARDAKESIISLGELYHAGSIASFNVDLMTGLPNQNAESAIIDTEFLLGRQVPSVTLEHTRIIDGTVLSKQLSNGSLEHIFRMNDVQIEQVLERQRALVRDNGYMGNSPLNMTTWVLPGHNRRYQLGYQLGFGASAYTTLPGIKYRNYFSSRVYEDLAKSNQSLIEEGGILSPKSSAMLSLQIELGRTGGLSHSTLENARIPLGHELFNQHFERIGMKFMLRDIKGSRRALTVLFELINADVQC